MYLTIKHKQFTDEFWMMFFSDTYQRIQTQRNQKWNYERYGLVKEFQRVPVIPMPLGAAIYIHYILRWTYRKFKKCTSVDHTKPGMIVSMCVFISMVWGHYQLVSMRRVQNEGVDWLDLIDWCKNWNKCWFWHWPK